MDLLDISQTLLIIIFGTIIITFFGIFFGLIFNGIKQKISIPGKKEKKISIFKPLKELRELFHEENVIPKNAITWIFKIAPMLGLAAVISILLYLPVAGFQPILYNKGDLILVLFLLTFPFLSRAIGGFSSGSIFAAVGAKKEMATMISYIFPLVIIIISIAWRLGLEGNNNVFSLKTINSNPLWNLIGPVGFIGYIILFIVFAIIMSGGSSKLPTELSQKNSGQTNGALIEYSGRNKAIYNIVDSVLTLVIATLMITLFLPYNISTFLGLNEYSSYATELLFYLVKIFIVVVISAVIMRFLLSRLKKDHIIYTSWVSLTLLSLVGLICIMWDQTIMTNFGFQPVFEMIGLT